ncbi:hypothetical protein F4859DRAFT_10694 [Xylaria cf. heliscus]|nr:hypothetical protein F4859DRAFT_10694 [Xylaria cf. heliscus]
MKREPILAIGRVTGCFWLSDWHQVHPAFNAGGTAYLGGTVDGWMVDCGLWVMCYGLWVVGYGLWVMGCGLRIGVLGMSTGGRVGASRINAAAANATATAAREEGWKDRLGEREWEWEWRWEWEWEWEWEWRCCCSECTVQMGIQSLRARFVGNGRQPGEMSPGRAGDRALAAELARLYHPGQMLTHPHTSSDTAYLAST